MKSNLYTFIFAAIVCIVCSVTLSAVSTGLKAKQDRNITIDIKKNILKAVGLRKPLGERSTPEQIFRVYEDKIEEMVIDDKGNVIEGVSPSEIKSGKTEGLNPLYVYKEGEQVMAYCFPIVGKGLWSTLYGYLALDADAVTVRGITFYKHGETPGLGAEIEKDWFQNNFRGKKIWSFKEDKLKPIKVAKGKVKGRITEEDAQYYVDGITGATMTAQGVTKMLEKVFRTYEPFFKKIRTR